MPGQLWKQAGNSAHQQPPAVPTQAQQVPRNTRKGSRAPREIQLPTHQIHSCTVLARFFPQSNSMSECYSDAEQALWSAFRKCSTTMYRLINAVWWGSGDTYLDSGRWGEVQKVAWGVQWMEELPKGDGWRMIPWAKMPRIWADMLLLHIHTREWPRMLQVASGDGQLVRLSDSGSTLCENHSHSLAMLAATPTAIPAPRNTGGQTTGK